MKIEYLKYGYVYKFNVHFIKKYKYKYFKIYLKSAI